MRSTCPADVHSSPAWPALSELSTTTLQKLLVRPARRAGELAQGHWLRAAYDNGLRRPAWLIGTESALPLDLVHICPACLRQPQPVWLEQWIDRTRPLCVEHQAWLVNECPGCGRPLRWSTVSFMACGCGQDLREIASPVLTAEVHQALVVDRVPLTVLTWLGALCRYGLAGKPVKKASRQRMRDVIEHATAGAEMVKHWPAGLFRVLDSSRIGAEVPSGSVVLLNEAFPGLAKRISKIKDVAWRTLVTKALGDYVAATRESTASRAQAIIGRNDPGGQLPTVARVARMIGVRPQRLAGALDALPESHGTRRHTQGGRVRRIVSDTSAMRARRALADEVTREEAARLMGFTVLRLEELVKAGRLQVSRGRLHRSQVLALRQRFFCNVDEGALPTDAIRVEVALRYWIPVDRTVHLLDAVHTCQLWMYRLSERGADTQHWMSLAQVKAWVSRTSSERASLTIPECAERLGLKQEVVYHLVRVGLIATSKNRLVRREAKVVSPEALAEFEQKYETLARAASRSGYDHRRGLDWALANSIELESGPRVDGGRQYFVRRTLEG